MDEVTIENFRCFRDRQTARLAPLTLLVGENGTGKTSFMALVRALWEIKFANELVPDFKKDPYDLGSFHEIAHRRGARGGKATYFLAGARDKQGEDGTPWSVEARFESGKTGPEVRRLLTEHGPTKLEWHWDSEKLVNLDVTTARGSWERTIDQPSLPSMSLIDNFPLVMFYKDNGDDYKPVDGSPEIGESDIEELRSVALSYWSKPGIQPFAGAPVRSRPRRTYDPSRAAPDPEGEWVPAYLASLSLTHRNRWKSLKATAEQYGKLTGVFDEIRIWQFGDGGGGPFQVQVRKHDGRLKGPWRNLIDVGYGVSQVLPLLIELIRPEAANILLLQQPEVHLHPSAQAALGTILCRASNQRRQLIVETHSDYLLDRVRMNVRDGDAGLKPPDVSVLYFERRALGVCIHSLEIDESGNILKAPDGYRQFFMDEVSRSLGIL